MAINLAAHTAAGGFAHGDTLVNIENLIGTPFANDILTGDSGDNVLAGLAGADTLNGQGSDTADYSASEGRVVVNLAAGTAAGGNAQGDTLISIENLIGTQFTNDILTGNAAANVLTGCAGGDTFNFQGSFNADTVTDYQHGVDTLNVSGAGGLVPSVDTADGARYTFDNGSSVLLLHQSVADTGGDFFVS